MQHWKGATGFFQRSAHKEMYIICPVKTFIADVGLKTLSLVASIVILS